MTTRSVATRPTRSSVSSSSARASSTRVIPSTSRSTTAQTYNSLRTNSRPTITTGSRATNTRANSSVRSVANVNRSNRSISTPRANNSRPIRVVNNNYNENNIMIGGSRRSYPRPYGYSSSYPRVTTRVVRPIGIHVGIGYNGFGFGFNYGYPYPYTYPYSYRYPRYRSVRYYDPYYIPTSSYYYNYAPYYAPIVRIYNPVVPPTQVIIKEVAVASPTQQVVMQEPVVDEGLPLQTQLIEGALRDGGEGRKAAVRGLGQFRNLHSVAVLVDVVINDVDAEVRAAAAMSLGEIGDPAGYEALLRSAASEHEESAKLAAEAAMAQIKLIAGEDSVYVSPKMPPMNTGDVELGQHLEALRFGDDPSRKEAADNLAGYPGTQSVAALIDTLMNDARDNVREASAESLGKLGDRIALPFLRATQINDPDKSVREEASDAVEKIYDKII
ncbi:MAG: HEAT repeat domain-containing protein [Planctomycetes bacterium]|nr:HEAT repeat domain-containing protein [Planctomycetota bacterium]